MVGVWLLGLIIFRTCLPKVHFIQISRKWYKYKFALDKFLATFQDQPAITGLTRAAEKGSEEVKWSRKGGREGRREGQMEEGEEKGGHIYLGGILGQKTWNHTENKFLSKGYSFAILLNMEPILTNVSCINV